MFKKPFILIILLIQCFSIELWALPSNEVYCDRVFSGLRWQRDECYCTHLTEERLKKLQPLIEQIIEKERELHEDYYQVLTGQDSHFLAYLTILKELYRSKYKQSFNEYEFLRAYLDPTLEGSLQNFFSNHPDLAEIDRVVEEWAEMVPDDDDDEARDHFWETHENDLQPAVSKQLISASLTLETNAPLDSTLHVFAHGKGMSAVSSEAITDYLVQAFVLEGYNEDEVKPILSKLVQQVPTSKEGLILQFFIPKEEILSFAYVSYAAGYLKKDETTKIHHYFQEHELKRDTPDFDTEKNDQVRILAGALDPKQIKIYKYSPLSSKIIEMYEEIVQFELSAILN